MDQKISLCYKLFLKHKLAIENIMEQSERNANDADMYYYGFGIYNSIRVSEMKAFLKPLVNK